MYSCNMGGMAIFAVAAAHGSKRWACRAIPGFVHKHPISTINPPHVRNCIPTTSALPKEHVRLAYISHNFFSQPHCPYHQHITPLSLQSFRSWLCQCQKLGRIELSHGGGQSLHSASPLNSSCRQASGGWLPFRIKDLI